MAVEPDPIVSYTDHSLPAISLGVEFVLGAGVSEGALRAAIVTGVVDGAAKIVNLYVFLSALDVGYGWEPLKVYSDEERDTPGTWHWPRRS